MLIFFIDSFDEIFQMILILNHDLDSSEIFFNMNYFLKLPRQTHKLRLLLIQNVLPSKKA